MISVWKLCLFFSYFAILNARKIFIAAPNTFHLDTNERIALVAYGIGDNEQFDVYLQDYPKKLKQFSSSKVTITNGRPIFVNIRFTADDIPEIDLTDAKEKVYVILVVKGNNFNEEFKFLVDYNAGFVFLQTDKPIYNPQQDVQIRVIPLNERLLPKNTDVNVKIKNPQNVIVYENTYKDPWKIHSVYFPTVNFKFPPYPMLGEWSVEASYGYKLQKNSSVSFKLEEYVLPTFTVELETPNVILPQHETVDILVKAEYVYGKKVDGTAIFKISIKNELGVIEVGHTKTKEVEEGESRLSFSLDEVIQHPLINKFPHGSKLIVEVSVVDIATGNKENAINDQCEFAKSPYLISFRNSLKDFKPGLISAIVADISYVNGKPAANVPTFISVIDSNNNLIEVAKQKYTSDENGHVLYHINTPIGPEFFTVTVTTNDTRYKPDQQFSAKHILLKSTSKGFIVISRTEGTRKVKVGDKFTATIFTVPPEKFENLFFLVMAQGKIIHISTVPKGQLLQRQLEFPVTADMSPVLRVVVFSLHENELVVDSLRVLVENQCSRFAEVEIKTDFRTTEPGHDGKFILEGEPDTKVGILAVDSAVYALRNKDRLTKEKLFKTLATRDLGCGPGGGINSEAVLSNAGLVLFGNFNTENKDKTAVGCGERIRKKREAIQDMVDSHEEEEDKKCCFLGTRPDKHKRSCEERAEILKTFLKEKENEENNTCIQAFLKCCVHLAPKLLPSTEDNKEFHSSDLSKAFEKPFEDLEFIEESDESDFERTLIRRDFRETWLFKDYIIGPDRTTEVVTSLPHSITTWVIQAISLSDQWGICISEPKEIVSFKNLFIHLNIPYSVVRNEQVEIQATVFNYNAQRIPVTVYMYGVEDLCTGVQAGEKSERKKIWVDPHSAENVGFPVVPLKDQKFSIHMVALSPVGSDIIIKELNVVPEGVPKIEDVVIVLDPTNQQKRKRRNVQTEMYTDSIDESQKVQITAIKLLPTQSYVPGTESCIVSAIGTEYGPTVETVLHDPETLIRMPSGCGEQVMMYMGPTLYTLRFLKFKGDVTPEREGKIYNFIREGYNRELTYRKQDGSYGAWVQTPSSTWLTAFVMKVFCQASKFVFIDENVICSGIKWLISQQKDDGSFVDAHPVYHRDMMGGNNGKIPLTAFVLIAFRECTCETEELDIARLKAELFLEISLPAINDPYIMAVTAYALSLSKSELKQEANTKLKQMSIFDEELNQRHWKENTRSHSIEVAAYALLTQLSLNDLTYSLPIVNWLNTQRLVGGSFPSTQDTVIALQALSEYSIRSQEPDLSLICNITSSNDRNLATTLEFQKDNALTLQQIQINKIGGTLFFSTSGSGVGSLSVQLRYNVLTPVEKLCKFEININVSEAKEKPKPPKINQNIELDVFKDFDNAADEIGINKNDLDVDAFKKFKVQLDLKGKVVRRRRSAIDDNLEDDENRGRVGQIGAADEVERSNSKVMLEVNICTKYFSDKDSEMTIVDAGIFSGFRPIKEDLDKLVNSTDNPVDRYEIAGRGVIFYLDKVSHTNPVCLKFRIRRDYIVGNIQASVIKVYDYYNNDDSCTKFYSPDSNSPLLRTICEDSVCQCAEGGCPLQKPFFEVSELISIEKQRKRLLRMACEEHDYVWMGKIKNLREENGFLYIDFLITTVLKAGIEPKEDVEGVHRELMMRDACKKSHLFLDQEYLIMGNDGARYENKFTKEISYRYLVDKTTKLQRYVTLIKEAEDKILQKAMIWLKKELLKKGCSL